MFSTRIEGQAKFSCRHSIRMTVCHRAGFSALVAQLHVRARPQSPPAGHSPGGQTSHGGHF